MADRTASRGSAPDPVLELLLDPGRLSGLLRTPVRVTRVRPKPGVSHTAVLLGPDGRVLGWIQALIGPARAKAVKARERAQRYGLAEQISSVPLPQWDAELVWGGLATDPALAKPLRRSGLDLTADDLVLLRYNPLRRLVLRAGDEVVRVTAEPHAQRMATVSQALAAQGLPVVTPRGSGEGSTGDGRATSGRVGPGVTTSRSAGEVASGGAEPRVMTSGRVSVWPWVEGTDLARDAEHPADLVRAAHLAGALAARLHTVTPTVVGLPRRGWSDLRAAAERAVTQVEAVAPEVADTARRALAGLPPSLPEGGRGEGGASEPASVGTAPAVTRPSRLAGVPSTPTVQSSAAVVLHGDLSLDQFLLGDDGTVWLTDLDRACLGPVEIDLASVWASEILREAQDAVARRSPAATAGGTGSNSAQWEAFLAGHGRKAIGGAWVAAALLARVGEPWRAQRARWREETLLIGRLALDQLTRAADQPTRSAADGPPSRARDRDATPPRPTGGSHGIPMTDAAREKPEETWRVPGHVAGPRPEDDVDVERAWPAGERHRHHRVAIEGRDTRGHLRAGTITTAGEAHLLPYGEDPRLPALGDVVSGGSLLVHRAGRRAVVHRCDGYLKVVRPGRAAAVAEASVRGASVARAAGLDAADVLECTDQTVRSAALPGLPVQRLSTDRGWTEVWGVWAGAWSSWQRLSTTGLEAHTPAHEAQVLRTWSERVGALGLLTGTGWSERLEATAAELDRSPVVDLVVAHRDLHDGQLLWDGQRIGVIDLDTVCRAEAALDLANLAVHAALRQAQGVWTIAAADVVREAVAEAARAGKVPQARLGLARRATVARLVAVYSLRPRWRDVVLEWAEQQWTVDVRA